MANDNWCKGCNPDNCVGCSNTKEERLDMVKRNNIFGYRMGNFEEKYGREGYNYFIHTKYDDRVISCWAVGGKHQVEATAQQAVDNMTKRDSRARLENSHQKKQTMKSASYGHVSVGTKLRGIERA